MLYMDINNDLYKIKYLKYKKKYITLKNEIDSGTFLVKGLAKSVSKGVSKGVSKRCIKRCW
jgi:hypothetical protein